MKRIVLFLFLVTLTSFESDRIEDEQKIIQKCFELEKVSTFFHGRQIVIEDNGKVSSKIKLSKYGQEVLIMSENELLKNGIKAFVNFQRLEIQKNYASVSFRYDFEGMNAEIKLEKRKNEWYVIAEKVYEN